MKVVIFLILIICNISYSQSLKYGTISYSGSIIFLPNVKGGSTTGEVGVKTFQSTAGTILEGFQYIPALNGYPACIIVKNANNDGPGSLRNAIGCALDNDQITFNSSMNGAIINLDFPPILINKSLQFINTNSNPIVLTSNVTLPAAHIYVSSTIEFSNLKLGSTNSVFRMELLDGAYVVWH